MERILIHTATSRHFPIRVSLQIDNPLKPYSITIGITVQSPPFVFAIWLPFIDIRIWHNRKIGDKYLAEI